MAAGDTGERSLKETPTWAVALVCSVFVIISILIEHVIHSLGKWFQKRQKKAMIEALEKIKAELMLLGFISLLLTVGTQYISRICIPAKLGDLMLPCKLVQKYYYNKGKDNYIGDDDEHDRRKLLFYNDNDNKNIIADDDHHYQILWRRALAAAAAKDDYCSKYNKVPLISYKGVHQLHIFIFVLAVFHVLYSVITIALAKAKMRRWKAWELETSSLEYQFTNDPARFRFTRQTSFVKRHSGLSRIPGIRWIVAFFRQFFGSVTKVDYMTMRHGFINAHFSPNTKFDFRKYIKRSMEDDFKMVVGISIPLWIFAIIFLLLNVYKWYTLSWLSVAPVIILLLVGTKLEVIIMEMAQEIQDRTTVVKGAPIVEPNNKFFWFNRPRWILFLLHFTLFQNAFQLAYFLWTWYEFGLSSCSHEKLPIILTRVFLGLALQIMCSYITFPLYALITQMGSHMKQTIFEEQTAKALRKWQKAAKLQGRRRNNNNKIRNHKASTAGESSAVMSGENTPSRGTSPLHLLHKHSSSYSAQSQLDQLDLQSVVSYRSDAADLSDLENDTVRNGTNLATIAMQNQSYFPTSRRDEEPHSMDFSFVKL